jgi:hypothetical protein
MHGGKALLIVLVVAVLGTAGVFLFVPGLRPGFVQTWFNKARGFTPAKSPNDALDKFKLALEKRDYQAASLYVSGDYKEWFDKGRSDAEAITTEIDNLRAAMKSNGVKSDKGDLALFMLEPFPATFKYDVKESADSATATLNWNEEISRFAGQNLQGWTVDNRAWNSLLPRITTFGPIQVTLKKESDGAWRIQIPVQIGNRQVKDTVDYLRKNGSNYKNALQSVKNEVKNNPTTKENFESALKTKLEESK